MIDFSNIASQAPKPDVTTEYPLPLQGSPVLIVAPATEDNATFYNESLRRTGKMLRTRGQISAAMVKQLRAVDSDLYPQYVIRGWRGIVDVTGKAVPFSVEAARQLVAALPIHVFDPLRAFCADIENFVGEVPDAEELAGN